MQTSRFQLGLIATLAVGLGFSLSSSEAVGYPAGAAISMGENPVWSIGNEVASGTPVELDLEIPDGQIAIISDLVFSTTGVEASCPGHVKFHLDTSTSRIASMAVEVSSWLTLGRSGTHQSYGYATNTTNGPSVAPIHFKSGLRVASGETLTLETEQTGCGGTTSLYTLSGYYAQP